MADAVDIASASALGSSRPVVEQLRRFVRVHETLNRLAARRGVGLPPQQLQAAMQLCGRGGMTVGELAAALGVSAGWASRMADELVADGHVVREHDAADRRIVRLYISPEMEARCAEVFGERVAAVEAALAAASPGEVEALVRLLGRIDDELERLAAHHAAALEPSIGAAAAGSEAPPPVQGRGRPALSTRAHLSASAAARPTRA